MEETIYEQVLNNENIKLIYEGKEEKLKFFKEDLKTKELKDPPFTLLFLNQEWARSDTEIQFYVNLCMLEINPFSWMKLVTDPNLGKDEEDKPINTVSVPAIVRERERTLNYCPTTRRDNVIYTFFYSKEYYGIGCDRMFQVLSDYYFNIPLRKVRESLHKTTEWQMHALIPGGTDQTAFVNKYSNYKSPYKMIQLDTLFMPSSVDQNHNCILTMIDAFSKKAWAWALHAKMTGKKGSLTSEKAFNAAKETIIEVATKAKENGHSLKIGTDSGGEFQGDFLLGIKWLNEKMELNIIPPQPVAHSSKRQGCIEAFNKKLKKIIFMNFTSQGKIGYGSWWKSLPSIIENYNNTPHGTTGFSPNELYFEHNQQKWFLASENIREQGEKWLKKSEKFLTEAQKSISHGDLVRRRLIKQITYEEAKVADKEAAKRLKNQMGISFKKHSYVMQWTRQIYKVLIVHTPKKEIRNSLPWVEMIKVPPIIDVTGSNPNKKVREYISNLLKVSDFNVSLASINIDNPMPGHKTSNELRKDFPDENAQVLTDPNVSKAVSTSGVTNKNELESMQQKPKKKKASRELKALLKDQKNFKM